MSDNRIHTKRVRENEEEIERRLNSNMNSILKRQNILKSHPDSLTDSELARHRTQVFLKNLVLYGGSLGVPAFLFFYCKTNAKYVALSGFFSWYFSYNFYSSKLFANDCEYSGSFISNLSLESLKESLKYNNCYDANPKYLWNARPLNIDHPEYEKKVTKNTYF